MTDFLLELLSEEIPARMQVKAKADLEILFLKQMEAVDIAVPDIEVFATPRRLALIAKGLPFTTHERFEDLKGPRVEAPPQALEGFLRKVGLKEDELIKQDGVWHARLRKPGRPMSDVLAEAIPAIIRAFPWPKSMRWGAASQSTESLRWVRPLQGIIALLGDEMVPCEIDGIASGRTTMGHRFLSSGPVSIANPAAYVEALRAAHVIVHFSERCALIRDGAAKAAADAGLVLVEDEALVVENAGLTEWPVPLLGRFDEAFLEVPPEVIQLTARVNQKYFVCESPSRLREGPWEGVSPSVSQTGPPPTSPASGRGELANAFICIANIAPSDGGVAIVDGNRKVLAARLSDARFFWEQDQKKTLAQHAEKLGNIVFHEKLGTVADKVERVAKLARWLCEEGIVAAKGTVPSGKAAPRTVPGGADESPDMGTVPERGQSPEQHQLATLAAPAARLCKADLVTEMVGEFPELQGIMGGYYAVREGLDPQVAAAIRDHYKPVGQGDDVPTAPVTVAVSLADKLDTLANFFAADMKPTGSRDPFALRRAALGIIELVTINSIRLPLMEASLWPMAGWLALESGREARRRLDALTKANLGAGSPLSNEALEKKQQDAVDSVTSREIFDKFMVEVGLPTANALLDFFADRLKVQQREAGVRHDLIDAVFALGGEDDLVRLLARVKALQAFMDGADGADLLSAYKRAANLLKQAGADAPSPQRGEGWGEGERGAAERLPSTAVHPHPTLSLEGEGYTAHDTSLLNALDTAEPAAAAAVTEERFTDAMAALASLRVPIDAFFEGVMVNDPDPAVRAFRLGLLARFTGAVHSVADFSKIEG